MDYRPDELARALSPTFLQRGKAYWRQGRVLSVQRHGGVVEGEVLGSADQVYGCEVTLDRDSRGHLVVDGECDCPVGYNCKHIAATLVAAASLAEAPDPDRPDPLVQRWLEALDEARTDPEAYPAEIKDRLLYVLSLREYPTGARALVVEPVRTRLLKNGGYGAVSPHRTGSSARFLRPSDHTILRQLAALSGYDYQLKGDWGVQLLRQMLVTGRCHWLDAHAPALGEGAPRLGRFEWELHEDGRQSLRLDAGEDALVLPLMPPWYYAPHEALCGPLETALPPRLAGTLSNAPRLSPEAADTVAERLRELPLPPPRRLQRVRREGVAARPLLRLGGQRLVPGDEELVEIYVDYLLRGTRSEWFDYARLRFAYDGLQVTAGEGGAVVQRREGEALIELERDTQAERAAVERLLALGFRDLSAPGYYELRCPEDWLEFMLHGVEALRIEGWRVEVDESFRYRLAEPEAWYADVDEDGHDWFSLELGVLVDGERISLLPLLARFLAAHGGKVKPDETLLLPLPDGRQLPVPAERVAPLLATLQELYDPDFEQGGLRLPRQRSATLAELDSSGALQWSGGDALRRLGEKLRDFRGIEPVPPPTGLRAELRDYQRAGLSWLQFLREYEFSGVLADDMGLGKTLQTLAHLLTERAAGRADRPSLVVAPTSLLSNWRREAARFAPELKVLVLHGTERSARFAEIPAHDLVITSYPLLPRDLEVHAAQPYHLLILDEAQHIKNPRAKAADAARRLEARQRLCLSGTPLENHLGELWSLFHFLMPGLLGDQQSFKRRFRTPIEKQGDSEREAALRRRVGPFLLRRTKEQVASELPPKTELLRTVTLDGGQRDLYETVRLAMHERIRAEVAHKGWERSQIVILDALLKLRQICCDPRLVKLEGARSVNGSAKLELLMELLPAMLEEGRRVLLFSQFTSMLELIEAELAPRQIDYVKLTGDTKDRVTPVDRFQNGEVPLFLISLKAGGTGLNLTAADTVIHYDPWWNPAVERQATDRAHRIGQDKPVFVYKLICEGTVEERITELQARKAALSEALLGDGAAATTGIKAEDLEALLGPPP